MDDDGVVFICTKGEHSGWTVVFSMQALYSYYLSLTGTVPLGF